MSRARQGYQRDKIFKIYSKENQLKQLVSATKSIRSRYIRESICGENRYYLCIFFLVFCFSRTINLSLDDKHKNQ